MPESGQAPYGIAAQGLSRAQEQLAGLVPVETRKALLERAMVLQPSLAKLRQSVGIQMECGDFAGAAAIFRQIPRFCWANGEPSAEWHDRIRAQLIAANCAISAPDGPSERLVVAFAFPPFADSSGSVMARRIEAQACQVDVISNDMSGRSGLDGGLYGAICPLIGHHLVLDAENRPAGLASYSDFVNKVLLALAADGFGQRHYVEVYSRAMWAQSHFAAAALLAAGHAETWTAEFSDPCRIGLAGGSEGDIADDGWLERVGIAGVLRKAGHMVPSGRSLMFWAEYLAFTLADRIVFTSETQRDFMVRREDYSTEVQNRALSVAVVEPHPAPGPLIQSAIPLPKAGPEPIQIGYFGNDNPKRDLSGLLVALSRLPDGLRERVQLRIFGKTREYTRQQISRLQITALVRFSPPLDYLNALAKMRQMDWLFVNDTACRDTLGVNPYLPSKLADYQVAGRAVLAFAEPGSQLSRTALPPGSIRADMTDPEAMFGALVRIASAGEQTLSCLSAAVDTQPNAMIGKTA